MDESLASVGGISGTKEQKIQSLTPACADARVALLLSGLSDDPGPLRPTQTARTSAKRFERPNYHHVFAHAVFCCAAYPIIYAGTVVANDKSLFWARAIVGVWCTGTGVVIGRSLVGLATKYAEAASTHVSYLLTFCTSRVPDFLLIGFCKAWATVIHLSHGSNGPGIKLKELANNARQPESAVNGVRLLWTRFRNRGTDPRARKAVEWVFHPSIY